MRAARPDLADLLIKLTGARTSLSSSLDLQRPGGSAAPLGVSHGVFSFGAGTCKVRKDGGVDPHHYGNTFANLATFPQAALTLIIFLGDCPRERCW